MPLNQDLSFKVIPIGPDQDTINQILRKEPEFGSALSKNLLQPYRPMPPLVNTELPDGCVERTIAIGLLPRNNQARHEIVGVNMCRRKVVRFEVGAPSGLIASSQICGPPPSANQPSAIRGTSGKVRVAVRLNNTEMWRFNAIEPAASSGTKGSGIEIEDVHYRGKRVLYRAHVPILNVRYDNHVCGPYRDWQWEEGMITANGNDIAPGFRT